MNGVNALLRRGQRALSLTCEDTARWSSVNQKEGTYMVKVTIMPAPGLELPASRTMRNQCLSFKPPNSMVMCHCSVS